MALQEFKPLLPWSSAYPEGFAVQELPFAYSPSHQESAQMLGSASVHMDDQVASTNQPWPEACCLKVAKQERASPPSTGA